jgi:endonuclease YncB( thermonuclease family)
MSVLLAACLITAVHDGDTVTANCQQRAKPISVRVAGIDAPEMAAFTWATQPGAVEARDHARELCLKKRADVRLDKYDSRTKRWVARVSCSGFDLGTQMVVAGLAWVYMPPAKSDLPALQRAAQALKVGVWANEAVAPSAWRSKGACR